MSSIANHVARTILRAAPDVCTARAATALGSLLLLSVPAFAADPAEDSGLAEVIVTAQFRQENLQATPLSITAVSGEKLEEQGLTNVANLGLIIPNANFRQQDNASGPNTSIGMRGVNTGDFNYASEPGVAVYVDDVYHGTLSGSAMDLLDLERVEVLRGPQGTLFGKNSLGGAIRLISKAPKGDNTGFAEATYGTSNRLDLKAGFDFALRDDLFMRVVGVSKRIDGYVDMLDFPCQMVANGTPALAGSLPTLVPSSAQAKGDCKIGEMGGSQTDAVRAMLRWLPREDLEVNLSADYSSTNGQPTPTSLLTPRDPTADVRYDTVAIFPTTGVHLYNPAFVTGNPFTTYANYNDPIDGRRWPTDQTQDSWSASGKVDWDINDTLHLKTIAAYRTYDMAWASDQDYTPFDLNTTYNLQHHEQKSIEVQLSGALFDKKVNWTTGAFYYDSKSELGGYVTFGGLSWTYYNPPGFGIPNFNQNDAFTSESKSAFAHVAWDITDRWSFTGGIRETSEDKTYSFDHGVFLYIPVPLQFGSDHFDWKVSTDFKLTDDIMVYGMVSTGFRSDGANPRPVYANQLQPVPREEITAFEVGMKADFLDRRLRVNASAFLNDYDPRVQFRVGQSCNLVTDATPGPYYSFANGPCPAGTPIYNTFGAGTGGPLYFNYYSAPGKAKGVELELTAQPVSNWQINASGGFYRYDTGVAQGVDGYVDASVRDQPRFSGSVGTQYTFNLGTGAAIVPRIDFFYQGERTNGDVATVQRDPADIVPAYTLANARLTYLSADGKWSGALSAENLFDKFYWAQLGTALTVAGTPTYNRTGVPGRGREVAFTIRRNF